MARGGQADKQQHRHGPRMHESNARETGVVSERRSKFESGDLSADNEDMDRHRVTGEHRTGRSGQRRRPG